MKTFREDNMGISTSNILINMQYQSNGSSRPGCSVHYFAPGPRVSTLSGCLERNDLGDSHVGS